MKNIGLVLFDEFHERHLHADLALALCLDAQRGLREDLKILVMSATLDGERCPALLGGAPIVTSRGRSFPVDVRYLGRDPPTRIEDRWLRPCSGRWRGTTATCSPFCPAPAKSAAREKLLESGSPTRR